MTTTLAETVAAASADLGDGALVGGTAEPPRFDLFHAPNSICSQKVRAVLAHHGLSYRSHEMNLFAGDTYRPGYVRLRMVGCRALGGALADRHGGDTSVSAGGCDGAVVPTLVDRGTGEVLVDSRRICLALDALAPEPARLRPAGLVDQVDEVLAVVDGLPNYQLLMGRPRAGGAATPDAMAEFSRRKVAWCDARLAERGDDPELRTAYAAKRAKEQSAADALFAPDAMAAAHARAEAAVRRLDDALAAGGGPWLFGARPTMADLFWGLELMRMRDVGAARFWEDLPRVGRLLAAAEALPAIRSAVVEWPGALFGRT